MSSLSESERSHLNSLITKHGPSYVAKQLGFQPVQLYAFLDPQHSMRHGTVLSYRERIQSFDPSKPRARMGRPKGSGYRQRHYSSQYDIQAVSLTYLQLWEIYSPQTGHPYGQYRAAMDRLAPMATLSFNEWFALISNGHPLQADPQETLISRQSKAQADSAFGRPGSALPLVDSHLPPHIAAKQSEVAFSVSGDFDISNYFYLLSPTNQTESSPDR